MNSNSTELNQNSLLNEKVELEPDPNSKNIVQKDSATTNEIPSFGWSSYAERMNGRFAMIGLIFILLIEALSNQSFLSWAGIIQKVL